MAKLKDYYYDDYNWLLKEYISNHEFFSQLFTDDDPGDTISQGIARRDSSYTELLGNYVKLTKRRNKLKEFHKWVFFWLIIFACAAFGYFLIRFVINSANCLLLEQQFTSDTLIAFVSALASLITVIVSIPIIITKYLFNTNEDDNIAKIIMGTQQHDSDEIPLLEDRFKPKNKPPNETTDINQPEINEEFENNYEELLKKIKEI